MVRATALCSLLVLSGCATCLPPPPVFQSPDEFLAGARIGLVRVHEQADVIIQEAAFEHALYPRAPASSVKSAACIPPAKVAGFPQAETHFNDLDADEHSTAADVRVWHKLCDGLSPMSLDDWRAIETSEIPADLAVGWSTHCTVSH